MKSAFQPWTVLESVVLQRGGMLAQIFQHRLERTVAEEECHLSHFPLTTLTGSRSLTRMLDLPRVDAVTAASHGVTVSCLVNNRVLPPP